ncbi:MAG: hypothetical protein ACOCYE_03905, partial [Pseudomonadota bacterium]
EVAFALFLDFVGDRPIGLVGDDEVETFKARLANLPARWGRDGFAGLAPSRCIDEANRLDRGEPSIVETQQQTPVRRPVRRLHKKTQNRHIGWCQKLYRDLEDAIRPYPLPKGNPFAKARYAKKEAASSPRQDRDAWDDAEMRSLLTSPLVQGRGIYRYGRGDEARDITVFWLAMLLAFLGVRPEEAAQLRTNDLVTLAGWPCLQFRDGEGQSVKNPGSVRGLPVPRVLRALGFLEFVGERRRAGETWLFPELSTTRGPARKADTKPANRRCTRSTQPLKRLRYYVQQTLGIAKDVYGIRHTANTILVDAGVAGELAEALFGRRPGGEGFERYFKGYKLATIADALEKIDYGVDLVPGPAGKPVFVERPQPDGKADNIVVFGPRSA